MERNIWALLHAEKNDDGKQVYGISFPDFPGVASGGETFEEAVARGRATLAFHLAGLAEDGIAIPTQRSLEALQADGDVGLAIRSEGAALANIAVDFPGRPVRVNISIDDGLLAALDRAAEGAGKTRSGLIAEAVREKLRT